MKFEVLDMANGEVLQASSVDACKAMTRLESLRKQRAFLIGRLGVFRKACVTLRVHKQRTEARLNAELLEARKDSDVALRIAERDKQALLDEVEALTEENHNLCDEITRLQEAYESLCSEIASLNDKLADEQTFALHGWTLARENAKHSAKVADRLHACRIDRRKWRDIAERCFVSAMKNAVALADERNGERGE